jgi:hypothetical protein
MEMSLNSATVKFSIRLQVIIVEDQVALAIDFYPDDALLDFTPAMKS